MNGTSGKNETDRRKMIEITTNTHSSRKAISVLKLIIDEEVGPRTKLKITMIIVPGTIWVARTACGTINNKPRMARVWSLRGV